MKKTTRFLMIACLALFGWQGFAQNGGDDCANAVTVIPGIFTDTDINEGTLGGVGDDAGAQSAAWFSYTPTEDGTINVDAGIDIDTPDTRLWIHSGTCGALTLVGEDDDGGPGFTSVISNLSVIGGTEYFIEWDDRWDAGVFDWELSFAPIPLSVPDCADNFMPADGTTDVPSAGSVDLTWDAPAPAPDSYDVFFGTDAAALTLNSNVTGSTASVTGLVAGTVYFYQIVPKNAVGDATGCAINSFSIEVPAGTNCDLAITVGEGIITDAAVIIGGAGGIGGGPGAQDAIWYSYTPTEDGTITVDAGIDLDQPDTRLWIHSGTCAALTLVGEDDDGGPGFTSIVSDLPVIGGTEYFIEWDDRWDNDVFDWELTFTIAPTCANPDDTAITVNAVTAEATWTASLGATSYDWEVVPTGNAQGTGVVSFENGNTSLTAAITGLTESTVYDFYIKADCFATYEGPITFTTNASCAPPEMLAAVVTGTNTATLSWSDINTPASASFQYEIVNITLGETMTGTPTASGITANSASVTSLLEDNDYEFFVRSICGSGGIGGTTASEWTLGSAWTQTVAPGCASNFMPADGATEVPIGIVTFTWDAPTAGGAAVEYDVLAGDTAALELGIIATVTTTTVDLNVAALNTTLFWQVIPKNVGGDAVGCTIQSFTTITGTPGGDDCSTALVVTDGTYQTQINDVSGGIDGGDDAWFVYTATDYGSIDVNACLGGQDTSLAIYADCADFIAPGDAGNNPIAVNDDSCEITPGGNTFASELVIDVVAGEDYYIRWDDRWSDLAFEWSVNFTAACPGTTTTWDGTSWDNGAPTTDSFAVIAGAYSTTANGNLDVCSLRVEDALTVDAETFARANDDITVTATGVMTVAHTGNVVQVDDTATVTNDGAITVSVNTADVDTRDFIMSGSPMTAETREGVYAAAFNVQAYDASLFDDSQAVFDEVDSGVLYNFQGEDLTQWSPATGTLNPADGYLVFPQTGINAPGGVFAHDYTQGTLNNGVVTSALSLAVAGSQNANMLSNPYASAIDADIFMGLNPEIDAVYFWEHGAAPSTDVPGPNAANFTMEDVSVYNAMGGMAAASGAGDAPNGVISTAQGFGVFASGAGTATFNNSMRLTSGNTTLRAADENRSRIWLNITSEAYEMGGNTLVGFANQATAGYDASYDSYRMATAVSLFSQIDSDTENGYGIQGRESFDAAMQVQLGFSTLIEENTTYRVSIADFDGPALQSNDAYLVDNVLGTVTNLSETDYVFASEEGSFFNRFTLQFVDRSVLGVNDADLNAVSISPNPTNGIVNIFSPKSLVNSVVITDIQGRVVNTIAVDSLNTYQLDLSSLGSAVYFVQITTDAGSITKRLIKR